MIPAPGGPELRGRVAFSPDDASPSRARLGRVAAMIADAERATPPSGNRSGHQATDVAVPLLPRRPRHTLPRPRTAGDDLSVSRRGSRAHAGTAVGRT
jgi:hypothetical protein